MSDTSPSPEASQDALTATIAVSVYPAVRERVQALAAADDRSESSWVRRLIMAELDQIDSDAAGA